MKEIKKEDDEVSIKSSRKSSRNGKQGRRHKLKRISRKSTFEGRTEELRVTYSIVQMLDKLIATRIQTRRSHRTWVLSISTEEISAIW